MVSSKIDDFYTENIAPLTPTERLRLVELITRGMADGASTDAIDLPMPALTEMPGWQHSSGRGDLNVWRDRAL